MKKQIFSYRSQLSCTAEELYLWHTRPECFELLTPEWAQTSLLSQDGTIEDEGSRATLKMKMGPMSRKWVAEHYDCIRNEQFKDRQVTGPFAYWNHVHRFEANDKGVILNDYVEYALPGWWLGQLIAGGFTVKKLNRLFEYRHLQTAKHLGSTLLRLEPESAT